MNKELIKNAKDFRDMISKLIDAAEKCNTAIEEIGHGADIRILGNYYKTDISTCCLDDGQEKLMQDMLVTILKSRIDDAENKLKTLLPKKEMAKA